MTTDPGARQKTLSLSARNPRGLLPGYLEESTGGGGAHARECAAVVHPGALNRLMGWKLALAREMGNM